MSLTTALHAYNSDYKPSDIRHRIVYSKLYNPFPRRSTFTPMGVWVIQDIMELRNVFSSRGCGYGFVQPLFMGQNQIALFVGSHDS